MKLIYYVLAAMIANSAFSTSASAFNILETFDGGIINTHNGTTVDWADGGSFVPWGADVSGLLAGDHYESGGLIHGTNSILNLTVMIGSLGGFLDFDYAVSSESGFDFFRLGLDGSEIFADSGTATSSVGPIALTPGTHLISFSYTKDNSVNFGADAAAIDNVSVTGIVPEPTSLLLVGLAGLICCCRRCR